MSAELLRRAAKVLREHVDEAVVAGPWEYRDRRDDPDMFPWTVYAPVAKFSAGTGFAPGTARYVALMHPPVALALANLLEQIEDHLEQGLFIGLQAEAATIVVARAILREET